AVNNTDNRVLFAGGPFDLTETGLTLPDGAVVPVCTTHNCRIEEVPGMPEGMAPGFCTFSAGTWAMTTAGTAASEKALQAEIDAARADKQSQIDIAFEAGVKAIKSGILQAEIDTFEVQEKEAIAFQGGVAAEVVPFITALAAARGLTVSELATRILAKADAYKNLMAPVLGRKHKAEDALDNAATLDEIRAVEI
ncbi:MAG: hypothetical protein MI862_04905, partial [Desulfobacterales bacterium]|nr:hypothetical protein [Desulfobacterales bacterium]